MQDANRIKIISIDEIKKALPGYSPDRSDDFHRESAKKADKLFDLELRKIKNQKVVLMCGGSASGKTEFIDTFFIVENFDGIVFDSTLSTIDGVEIKIRKIKKSGNEPVICFVLPDDLRRCFSAFNKRERKIPEFRFYETHSGARKVILRLAKEHPDIVILIYQTSYNPDELIFDKERLSFELIEFLTQTEMVCFLEKIQYSEEEIFIQLVADNK
jgi:hypothetical protein